MKWAFWIFVALYVIAFVLFLIGNYGLFGSEQGPLAGVFLMPLGLPWNLLGDKLGLASPALGILAPAINAAILYGLWKRFGS
ncbi:MAG: hypothetical protein KDE32_05740 [Novosphingobium sp.]|nr:hypothetical protein [Novosphingobium sp.]